MHASMAFSLWINWRNVTCHHETCSNIQFLFFLFLDAKIQNKFYFCLFGYKTDHQSFNRFPNWTRVKRIQCVAMKRKKPKCKWMIEVWQRNAKYHRLRLYISNVRLTHFSDDTSRMPNRNATSGLYITEPSVYRNEIESPRFCCQFNDVALSAEHSPDRE